MFICQWHLDLLYGKQAEALAVMRAWGAEKFSSSEFRKARSSRLLVGHVGMSPSRVVDKHSDALAPFVVPGSQQWKVLRVV